MSARAGHPLPALAGRVLRRWLWLAVVALGLSGLLAVPVATGRIPAIIAHLPWLGDLFPRALVTHVVLSLVVWYLCALLAVKAWAQAPEQAGGGLQSASQGAVAAGLTAMAVVTLTDAGAPSLNNYVPVITHWGFLAGLALVAVGLAAAMLPALQSMLPYPDGDPHRHDDGHDTAVGSAAVTLLAALTCVAIAAILRPPAATAEATFEWLFWGGGHVLQVLNTLLLLIAWQAALDRLTARPMVPVLAYRALAGALATIALAGPLIYLVADPLSGARTTWFTWLYSYPIAAVAGVMTLAAGWRTAAGWRHVARADKPLAWGLALSVLLFAVGGLFGFWSGQGDTRTPGHYHAVIGGVNLAVWVATLGVLLPAADRVGAATRTVLVMMWTYGIGQMLHATALFVAGGYGIARKTTADAQVPEGVARLILDLKSGGLLLAMIGGILFVWVVLRRLAAGPVGTPAPGLETGQQWRNTPATPR